MDQLKKNEVLDNVALSLDITPDMYNIAMSVVSGLETFIKNNAPGTEIYKHGSFRLGTIIKPRKKDKNGDFDIDIVVQFPYVKESVSPSSIKRRLGEYLKSQNYCPYLEDEGKRCWTLNYRKIINKIQQIIFHIDLLPSVGEDQITISKIRPDNLKDTSIAITDIKHKNKKPYEYSWETSNPKGFAQWFDVINYGLYHTLKNADRQRVYNNYRHLFESAEKVGDDYTRTPLQKVIQILKRHRDIMYCNTEFADDKPISIIITTLVAKIVEENNLVNKRIINSTYDLLDYVVKGLEYYSSLQNAEITSDFADDYKTRKLISKNIQNGKAYWRIENPANSGENLANRWNEHPQKAQEFFRWVRRVQVDLLDILEDTPENIKSKFKYCLGEQITNRLFENVRFDAPAPAKKIEITSITPKPYKGIE
ncbi:MAG: nucleotidyltransferase [Syntrophomonadaceae bacterium]|jgi:hypothetical protein|nr:nucleotidyltransferase [Syntrophomonadaceae bacterium]